MKIKKEKKILLILICHLTYSIICINLSFCKKMDITTIYKISKCRLINLIYNLKFFQLLMGKELFIVENFKKKRYFFPMKILIKINNSKIVIFS